MPNNLKEARASEKFDWKDPKSGKGWYLKKGESLDELKERATGKKKGDDKNVNK